jgi:hypothetical protein
MALNNPLLGKIPQPIPETQEVLQDLIPRANYGAKQTTPLYGKPFSIALSCSGVGGSDETDSETSTEEAVITGITFTGFHQRDVGGAGSTATYEIIIGQKQIFYYESINSPDGVIPISGTIPIDNWKIGKGTLFKINTIASGTADTAFNVSFFGFVPIIQ